MWVTWTVLGGGTEVSNGGVVSQCWADEGREVAQTVPVRRCFRILC